MGDPLGADAGRRFGRRLLLVVDAKSYGASSSIRQREFQEAIPRLVAAASQAAGLEYTAWETQPQGDALFAVLPEGASEPALVDTFMRALEAGLRNYNESRLPEAWLRLRASIHYGPAERAPLGFVGPGPVELARVNACADLHTALTDAPEAHLAVGVTEVIYTDVVRPGYTTLRPAQFRKVEVVEKEHRGSAWIWVPNETGRPDAAGGSGGVPGAPPPVDTSAPVPAQADDPASMSVGVYNHNHHFTAPGANFGIQVRRP